MTKKDSSALEQKAAQAIDIPEEAMPRGRRKRDGASDEAPKTPKRAKKAETAPDGAEAKPKRAKKAGMAPDGAEAKPKSVKKAGTATDKPEAKPRRSKKAETEPDGAEEPKRAKKAETTSDGGESKPRRKKKSASPKVEPGISRERTPGDGGRRASGHAGSDDDIFLEAWDAPPKKRKKRGKRRQQSRMVVAVNLMLMTGIAAMIAFGGLLVFKHNVFLEMKQVVEAQTFYDGTTVEGVDVSDMTLKDAMAYWQQRIEPGFSERTVHLSDGAEITAAQLGYRSDYEAVLSTAWSAGRRGSLEQRYRAAVQREAYPVAYKVDRTLYAPKQLDAYVEAMSEQLDRPAVDAGIESFDTENYAFVFTQSESGCRLDAEGLKRQIAGALESGGGSAEVVVETIQPTVTTDEVSSKYGMIAFAVTNASSSSSNRIRNIQKAMDYINGKCLKPGEVFSFNDTVGRRTRERGFRVATAYSSGTVKEEVGGGICQVSTTLFNAAVKSDMQVVERHNHSLTVSYVDKGKDATVNWKSQDLKFKNTSDGDVYICCMLSKDKRVRVALFGRLLENGESITVEAKTTKTIKYDTRYEANPLLAPGQSRVTEQGKNGYQAEAYKVRWDADGNQISKELLCKSVYKARDAIVQVGT